MIANSSFTSCLIQYQGESTPILLLDGKLCLSAFYFITQGNARNWNLKLRQQACRAIGLYFDYSKTNNSEQSIRQFVHSLKYGTIITEENKTSDPTGLLWNPLSNTQLNKFIHYFEEYLKYCFRYLNFKPLSKEEQQFLTDINKALQYETSFHKTSPYSFMSHLNNLDSNKVSVWGNTSSLV